MVQLLNGKYWIMSVYAKIFAISEALEGLSPEHPTILMAHDPTFWDKRYTPSRTKRYTEI